MKIRSYLLAYGVSVLGACIGGCSTGSAPQDVEFIQSPMGYVSPEFTDEGVPFQIGPNPVYDTPNGAPNVYVRAAAPPFEMVADSNGFSPASFAVRPGQLVTIHLVNRTEQPQSFMLESSGTKIKTRSVPPGATDTLQFTAPMSPGSYRFYSPGADDQHGIEGKLIVLEPAAPSQPLPRS